MPSSQPESAEIPSVPPRPNCGVDGLGALEKGDVAVGVGDGAVQAAVTDGGAIGETRVAEDDGAAAVEAAAAEPAAETANELPPQLQLSDAEVMSVISLKQLGVDVQSFLNQFSRSLVFDCELLRVTPRAWVTPTLVLLNLAMFGLVTAQTGRWEATVGDYIQWGANNGARTASGEPWRLLTCIFLHAGVIHLLLNMWMLWTCGRVVERLLGNGSFLMVYLFAGVCGSLASVVWNSTNTSIGASGAVFGILAAHLGLLIRRRRDFPIEAIQQHRISLLTFFIANAGIGWMLPAIDMAGHVGGLVAGLVFGLVFRPLFLLPPTSSRRSRLVLQALFAISVSAGGAMLLPRPNSDPLHTSNLFPKKSAAQLEEDRRMMISLIERGDSSMQLGEDSSDNPLLRNLAEFNRINALRSYINAHDLALQLSNAKRDDPQAQRDLADLSNKFGEVFRKLGGKYDAQKQHDFAVSFNKLGEMFRILGRTDDALAQFQEELKIRRTLAVDDPNNAGNQSALMVSYYTLGYVHLQAGQVDQAQEQYALGIAVLNDMITKAPTDEPLLKIKASFEYQQRFCANVSLAAGDWETLLKAEPQILPQLLILRAQKMLRENDLVLAVQAGNKLRELDQKNKSNLYNAACVYARCAEFVTKDKPEPTEAELSARQEFLELALACLKQSIAAGYDNFDHMREDGDLKPLHGLPKFEGLFPIKKE